MGTGERGRACPCRPRASLPACRRAEHIFVRRPARRSGRGRSGEVAACFRQVGASHHPSIDACVRRPCRRGSREARVGPSQRRLHRSSPDLRLPARPAQPPAASTPARTEPPAGGAPLGGRRSMVPALTELRLCCLPIVHRCHWGIRAGGICAGGGSMHLGSLNMRHAFQEPPPPDCTTLVLLSTIH